MPTAKETISHWEKLKKLIARENIWADMEIGILDNYFNSELEKEIDHGKPTDGKRIHPNS